MNRIPLFTDAAWRQVEPPYTKNADFTLSPDGLRATVHTVPDFGVGKLICRVPVRGGAFYDFAVSVKTVRPECDHYILLTPFTEAGKTPIREHAKHCVREGDYLRFSDKIDTAPDTVRLEIELWVKGKDASGEWELPTLTEGEPLPARRAGGKSGAVSHLHHL